MIYLIKHSNKKNFLKNNYKILCFLLVVIIFFVWDYPKNVLINKTEVFASIGNHFYENNFINSIFSSKHKLILENEKLKIDLENIKIDIFDDNTLKIENQKLRNDLNLRPEGNYIATSIIIKPPQISYDSIIVNKGNDYGISFGDMALVSNRVAVGRVVEVRGQSSVITLNSFPKIVSNGFIARTNEQIEVEGIGGFGMRTKLPIDFDINQDDLLMSTGSRIYMIGKVLSIEEDKSSGFKNVVFGIPISINNINTIFIKKLE